MAEPTNNSATKVRITMAVLNRTIELQGQYTRERLDALEEAVKESCKEHRILHDRIDKTKEDIATLKTRTGLIAGLNSLLALIASAVAGIWATRS